MSITEADSENQVTSSTGNAEEMSEPVQEDQKNVGIKDKPDKDKSVDTAAEPSEITTNEVSCETMNVSSETSVDAVDESKIEPVSSNNDKDKVPDTVESTKTSLLESSTNPEDVQDQLQKILGDASVESTPKEAADAVSEKSSNVTTENLLSVLEDDLVTTPKKPTEPSTPSPTQSATKSKPGPASTKPTSSTPLSKLAHAAETSKSSKRYIYKLKSKSGKVLRYTSCTPIILKKPVIKLTKMAEEDVKAECAPKDIAEPEVDSDNSTKENMKENDASGDATSTTAAAAAATPAKTPRRGRPPLSQKKQTTTSVAGGAEDRNSSDTSDNKTTPAFSMQTRKRQIKFLPDGRVMSTGKKQRYDDSAAEESPVTENEADYDTDDTAPLNKSSVKKHSPPERSAGEKKGKFKKVFDFESYFREKTGATPTPVAARSQVEAAPPATPSVGKVSETPKSRVVPSPTTSKKVASVDPAQLLSSLIGVPIAASQLNIVKFKPKVIQERTNAAATSTAATPKKVHFEDTAKKPASSSAELLKNTPFKVVSKPTFQKILPKPTIGTPPFLERSPARKGLGVLGATTPTTSFSAIAPKGVTMKTTPKAEATVESPKFESYTDTKVVKTKGGPKKAKKRKSTDGGGDDAPKTVYDLVHDVFDQMPSWNLHVIPDTKSFCIAQVARGRMGIPILKKSIELNSEFFAKVYVHQLHCKRYDGVYDTESKIVTLIREIDALAA